MIKKKHLTARHWLTAGKITAAAIMGLLLFLPGCGREDTAGLAEFSGAVLDLTEDGAFVEPNSDEEIRKSADWIYFGTKELEEIGVKVGDLVSVTYTGHVAESYPAQIQAVKWELVEIAGNMEKNGRPSAKEEETESEVKVASKVLERDLDTVKTYLAGFSNDYNELKQSESYFIVHGNAERGEERFEQFCQAVVDGEPAELTIIQFTTEGDAIFDYLNYNGTDFYLVHDNSRDGFIGSGDLYQEYMFPYLKIFEEPADQDEKRRREIVLTDSEALTYEEMELFFQQKEGEPSAEIYYIAGITLD